MTKPRGRPSKATRLSTQSDFGVALDAPVFADRPAEEDDSVLTTATNATAVSKPSRKMSKAKKGTTVADKKTQAKQVDTAEVEVVPEPEDADFEVKVDTAVVPSRGRKRVSDEMHEHTEAIITAPAAKRRVTRTRGSMAVGDHISVPAIVDLGYDEQMSEVENILPIEKSKKPARASAARKVSRKVSTASAASKASLRSRTPTDEELDQALQADLDRSLTEGDDSPAEEEVKPTNRRLTRTRQQPVASTAPTRKNARSDYAKKEDHAMFDIGRVDVNDSVIEAELNAMETEAAKLLALPKGTKGKQPRKASAKQVVASKKAALEAQVVEKAVAAGSEKLGNQPETESDVAEVDTHISLPASLMIPKSRKTGTRIVSSKKGRTSTKPSTVQDDNDLLDGPENDGTVVGHHDDSGNETDASIASQSTVITASKRRGSVLKKGKGGKKTTSGHIEEIVHKSSRARPVESILVEPRANLDAVGGPSSVDLAALKALDIVPEAHVEEATQAPIAEPAAKPSKIKSAKLTKSKGKGKEPLRPAVAEEPEIRAATSTHTPVSPQTPRAQPSLQRRAQADGPPHRSPSPPQTKELTPSPSPQSSDAENRPPRAHPIIRTPARPTTRMPLAITTPTNTTSLSPSKRNVIAGLETTQPWTAVDLDSVFGKSPGKKNAFREALDNAKSGKLTSPEKNMTVEDWIKWNAVVAEERLREECERMVGAFEMAGGRAMGAVEGIVVVE